MDRFEQVHRTTDRLRRIHVNSVLDRAQALESKYVSEHLHEWIDLIFGYKQRGTVMSSPERFLCLGVIVTSLAAVTKE